MSDRLREALERTLDVYAAISEPEVADAEADVRKAARKWADFLDDPVAAVRRGVESGQIEGWFKRWCVKHDCEGLGNADRGEIGCTGAGVGRAVDMDCRLVPVLIAEVDGL